MTDLLTPNTDGESSEPITIQTGDAEGNADAGDIVIRGGDATVDGGSIYVRPGSGGGSDSDGRLAFFDGEGSTQRVMARPASGPAASLWDVLHAYGLVRP